MHRFRALITVMTILWAVELAASLAPSPGPVSSSTDHTIEAFATLTIVGCLGLMTCDLIERFNVRW